MPRLHGSHPALFIIDMQNGVCHDEGTFSKLGMPILGVEALVTNISRLRALAHERKMPVYFTEMSFASDYSDAGLQTVLIPGLVESQGLQRGTWDAAVLDRLRPRDDETLLRKTKNSAFFGTDLAADLRAHGVDQIIATGVGTNVCVESTVRDALNHGFHVVTVSDATGTVTHEAHAASMTNLAFFGGTISTVELAQELKARGGA